MPFPQARRVAALLCPVAPGGRIPGSWRSARTHHDHFPPGPGRRGGQSVACGRCPRAGAGGAGLHRGPGAGLSAASVRFSPGPGPGRGRLGGHHRPGGPFGRRLRRSPLQPGRGPRDGLPHPLHAVRAACVPRTGHRRGAVHQQDRRRGVYPRRSRDVFPAGRPGRRGHCQCPAPRRGPGQTAHGLRYGSGGQCPTRLLAQGRTGSGRF